MMSQNYFPEPNRYVLTFLHPILLCMFTYGALLQMLLVVLVSFLHNSIHRPYVDLYQCLPHSKWQVISHPNPDRVNWLITNHLLMTEHIGRYFSILLHFERSKMLQEHLLRFHKSYLKCKAKGPAKKEQQRKFVFLNPKTLFFSFFFILTPRTFKCHNFLYF
jgi:hypothetical protein